LEDARGAGSNDGPDGGRLAAGDGAMRRDRAVDVPRRRSERGHLRSVAAAPRWRRSRARVVVGDRVADVADGDVVHAGAGVEVGVVAGQAGVAGRRVAVDVVGALADADVDGGAGPCARAERAGRALAGAGGGARGDALAGGDAARAAFGAGRAWMAG